MTQFKVKINDGSTGIGYWKYIKVVLNNNVKNKLNLDKDQHCLENFKITFVCDG